jgi:hypothetical protein
MPSLDNIKTKEDTRGQKVKKDLEGLSQRAKKSRLKLTDLIIPISSFVILLLLSIFLFIPMISTANEYRIELKETNDKISQLDELEVSLNEIDDTQLISDLLIAGDISLGGDTTKVRQSLAVSGPLSYTGTYSNVLSFLDEIQAYSPYLVTLKNISLSNRTTGKWLVEFELTGYYIPEQDKDPDLYVPFSQYTKFSDIIDIFSVRVERLDE